MTPYQQIDNLDKTFFNELRDKLVPWEGAAKIVAGEIIRAMDRLIYRYYNDGDMPGHGYGNETCNSSYRYLSRMLGEKCPYLNRCCDDDEYETLLLQLATNVKEHLESHPELLTEENTFDSRKRDPELDVDDSYYEDEDDWYEQDKLFEY